MPSCGSCKNLRTCLVVNEKKLASGYYCGSWVSAAESVLTARDQINEAFGPWALRYELPTTATKSVVSRMRRRHKNG